MTEKLIDIILKNPGKAPFESRQEAGMLTMGRRNMKVLEGIQHR